MMMKNKKNIKKQNNIILPQMQFETVPILTKSILHSFKSRGFTCGKKNLDLESGHNYINIYLYGNIVKKLFYLNDETKGVL